MAATVTIRDVSVRPNRDVTGKLIKRYEKGVTIDDERGVRYYAYNENIIRTHAQATVMRDNGLW